MTGQDLERTIGLVCDGYRLAKIADIRKVDNPIKVFGAGPAKRVIHLENPWLDFVGVWTAAGGRMVCFEVKCTVDDTLRVLNPGQSGSGISHAQLMNALRWKAAGAAVGFLWGRGRELRIMTPTMVQAATLNRRSVRWIDAHRVPEGPGQIFFDFLPLIQTA